MPKTPDAAAEKKAPFTGFGIICAIVSSVFYSLNAAVVKMVDLHPTQLTLSRCTVQFLILLPIIQRKYKTVDIMGPEGLRYLLWARGFIGSSGNIFFCFAISELSVGNAVTISYLNMIMVPFIAWIFLKEQISFVNVIFVLICLGGVVLIAQPTFLFPNQDVEKVSSVYGVLFGLASAVFIAVTIVTIRKLGPVTYPPLNVLYYSFCGSLTTTIILLIIGEFQYPCWNELPLVFLIGILGLLGQIFLTLALQTERAGTVSVLGSVKIIFIYTIQITLLGDIPSVLSIVGASLVLMCSIGIGIRKLVIENKEKMKIKK